MNIALITARGGSKGLARKNILPLSGKPLIAWTIEAALASNTIDRVFVSTEDIEISQISQQYGAEVIIRPMELALDNSSSEAVIEHAICYLTEQRIFPNNVCLLQPTSPLRNSEDIDTAFELFNEKKASCVISVFEPKHSPVKSYKLNENGTIEGLLFGNAPYCRRQDLPTSLQPNGAIYIFMVPAFIIKNQIPRENVFPFIMPEEKSIDVDTIEDLNNIQTIMKSKIYDQSII